MILATKVDIINKTIDEAEKKLANMPEDEYFAALYALVKKYSQAAEGEMLLSSNDLGRLPKDFESKINEGLADGAKITVRKTATNISQGFILVYGDIEINCTFDALIDDARDDIKDELYSIILPEHTLLQKEGVLMKREIDYAYAVARVRANELKLLSESDIDQLIAAEDYKATMHRLSDAGWGDCEGYGETRYAEYLENNFNEAWDLLVEILGEDIHDLDLLLIKNDMQNLKAALKGIVSQHGSKDLYAKSTVYDDKKL